MLLKNFRHGTVQPVGFDLVCETHHAAIPSSHSGTSGRAAHLGLIRARSSKHFTQGIFLRVVERCSQDLASYSFKIGKHLVGSHLADQEEEGSIPRVYS